MIHVEGKTYVDVNATVA